MLYTLKPIISYCGVNPRCFKKAAKFSSQIIQDKNFRSDRMDKGVMAGGEEFTRTSAPVDYEMWLRMAADNKINAKNSWNFALIDYFYDLSFQPVTNFQRASAILDGCIKIYSSRIDSAVTETGTLLSGLSSSRHLNSIVDDADERTLVITEEEPKQYRRRNIRLENTLVSSFEHIRIKNIEKELVVDPIFKKTIANFDEGGAKSLLLNTLVTDNNGRLILDSDNQDTDFDNTNVNITEESWNLLRGFLEMGTPVENLSVCESMGALKQLINKTDEIIQRPLDDHFDLPTDYGSDNEEYNDYDDLHFDNDDNLNNNNNNNDDDYEYNKGFHTTDIPDYELMEYFDNTMRRNPKTLPTFWKVDRVKAKTLKPTTSTEKLRIKSSFIDFQSNSIEEDILFEDEVFSKSVARISIPILKRKKGISYNNFCLTEDHTISTQSLVELFTKKTAVLNSFMKKAIVENEQPDEDYTEFLYDEPSRLLDEITREDINELNKSYVEDFSESFRPQLNLMNQLNYEKISKRIDIASIKQQMLKKLNGPSSFSELIKDLPSNLNGTMSVYFICLLHLSNEMNLSLEYKEDNDLLVYTQT